MPTSALPQIQAIPLDQIVPSPYQTRKDFDEEKLKELAQTMKHGLINAIVVRKVRNRYELIAGERRTRAAKLLGWKTIEAKLEDVDDQEAARQVVVDNLQRDDLNPIEVAEGYKKLVDLKMTQTQIAARVGKDQGTIARYLYLLDLPIEIRKIMSRDIISERHIRVLKQIDDRKEFIRLAEQSAADGWSVKETEQQVKKLLGRTAKPGHSAAPQTELDPLAEVWGPLRMKSASAGRLWGVDYKTQIIPGVGVPMPAWHFWIANQGVDPREDLKKWAAALLAELGGKPNHAGRGMRDSGEGSSLSRTPPAVSRVPRPTSGVPDHSVPDSMLSRMPVEVKPGGASKDRTAINEAVRKFRKNGPTPPPLPGNKEEQAELEALAAKGPQAVYAWIYGKDHILATSMEGTNWKQMGYLDPAEGARDVLKRIERPRKKGLWGMFS